jgi:hypothetical protein
MNSKLVIRIVMFIVLGVLGAVILMGQTGEKHSKAEFSKSDRDAVNDYYKHLLGTLAPASLDRKGFSPEIERALRPGAKVPLQLEKQLELLPTELEKKLSMSQPGYVFYKLGRHVLLVRRTDLMIADIIRDAGWK